MYTIKLYSISDGLPILFGYSLQIRNCALFMGVKFMAWILGPRPCIPGVSRIFKHLLPIVFGEYPSPRNSTVDSKPGKNWQLKTYELIRYGSSYKILEECGQFA